VAWIRRYALVGGVIPLYGDSLGTDFPWANVHVIEGDPFRRPRADEVGHLPSGCFASPWNLVEERIVAGNPGGKP